MRANQEHAEKILEKAKSTLFQFNLKEAIGLTEKAINIDQGLTEAYRFLSHLYFYFEKDYSKAHELINKAIEISDDEYQSYKIKGDIYYDENKFNAAIESYKKALEMLTSLDSDILAQIGDCYLSMGNYMESKRYYQSAVEEDPLCIHAIRKLRVRCVEEGEYMQAFELWKLDHAIDENKAEGTIELNRKNMKRAVENIMHHPIDYCNLIQLGNSYYEATLYKDAAIIYKKALRIDSSVSDIDKKVEVIEVYFRILVELKGTSIEIYNSIIHGKKRKIKKHKQMIYSILLKLVPYFEELKNLPRKMNRKSWKQICGFYLEEFKLHIGDFFERKNLYGTYTSYVINKLNLTVNYWDKKGKLQFIELGMDIDQGYCTWVWKYLGSGTGGWVSPKAKNTVYNVTDRYKRISKYWKIITDERVSKIWDEKAEKDLLYSNYDVDEIFYSEGLNYRFRSKFINEIYNEAIKKYDSEKEQKKYFFKKIYKTTQQISIITHEGQHAIDMNKIISMIKVVIYALVKRTGGYSSALEYKAKLAELYYGETPYYSLSALMSQDINSNSPHGKANTIIFKRIVKYIQNNPHDFQQIDVSKNILLQLNKLDTDQVRTIAKYIFE